MELKWVTKQSCPECESRYVIAEFDRGEHCSGERFQERKFDCGYVVGWSPKFSRLEKKSDCTRSTWYLKNLEERKRLRMVMEDAIDASNLPDKEKERIEGYLHSMLGVW